MFHQYSKRLGSHLAASIYFCENLDKTFLDKNPGPAVSVQVDVKNGHKHNAFCLDKTAK